MAAEYLYWIHINKISGTHYATDKQDIGLTI